MKKFLCILIFVFAVIKIEAQSFYNPLDTPMYLAATFAELRPNHFHSGIDIKTGEEIGKPVYAIEDGYVYRIKVSPYGFGNALYIKGYKGYTSVYAHLSRFAPKIENLVKKEMYKRKTNSIEWFPKKVKITVKKGEIIAYSGNTGSSHGPHLHFEIRKSKSEHPINPLKYGFCVYDTVRPVIYSISIDDLSSVKYQYAGPLVVKQTNKLYSNNNADYYVLSDDTLNVPLCVGVSVESFDFLNGYNNKCGVYSIEMQVNAKSRFKLRFDEFSFYETRYINSLINYPIYYNKERKMYRLYKQPNNILSIERNDGNGKICFKQGEIKHIKITIEDTYGNRSVVSFVARGDSSIKNTNRVEGKKFLWRKTTNEVISNDFSVYVPGKALYDNMFFVGEAIKYKDKRFLSPLVDFSAEAMIPLHKKMRLQIKPYNVPNKLQEKLTVALVDGNTIADVGGNYQKNGMVETYVREFGKFVVMADTVSPIIKPLNIYEGKNMQQEDSIVFNVTDNLTGVGGYKCYIDGKWTRVERDIKTDNFYCQFKEVLNDKAGESHSLIFSVVDDKNNWQVYKTSFVY